MKKEVEEKKGNPSVQHPRAAIGGLHSELLEGLRDRRRQLHDPRFREERRPEGDVPEAARDEGSILFPEVRPNEC